MKTIAKFIDRASFFCEGCFVAVSASRYNHSIPDVNLAWGLGIAAVFLLIGGTILKVISEERAS